MHMSVYVDNELVEYLVKLLMDVMCRIHLQRKESAIVYVCYILYPF